MTFGGLKVISSRLGFERGVDGLRLAEPEEMSTVIFWNFFVRRS
jgi:hypothetical protein